MLPASVNRNIDPNLKNIVAEIESKNPNYAVLSARKFRYGVRQNIVELTIKEPRPFNVLEEFIIRAGLEFEPPPTSDDLASILGLDPVFVHSTVSTLQSLQTLAVKSPITVTNEGKLFYEKGTVPQPPYTVLVYAVTDSLEGKFSFYAENLDDGSIKLPDLAKFIKIEDKNIDLSLLTLERIQRVIQDSGLSFHIPDAGKLVTAFKVIPPNQLVWRNIAVLVIFEEIQKKFMIEIRSGRKILATATNKINALFNEGKLNLAALCDLPDEIIKLIRNS